MRDQAYFGVVPGGAWGGFRNRPTPTTATTITTITISATSTKIPVIRNATTCAAHGGTADELVLVLVEVNTTA